MTELKKYSLNLNISAAFFLVESSVIVIFNDSSFTFISSMSLWEKP